MDTSGHSSDLASQSKTPIASLPPEILLQIFTSVLENPKWGLPSSHRCIPLAHVCRFWREVALSAPNLWSKIRHPKLPWAIAMLKHSQMAPLTVAIWGQDSSELIEPIFKHLARIEKLEIRFWDAKNWRAMQSCIETNACTAPLLRSIELEGRINEFRVIWSLSATMFQHAVQLQDLRLEDISLDWANLPDLPNLTEMRLKISEYKDKPTWMELTDALRRMPALKHLTLEGAIWDTTAWPNSGAVAHLPCLERVELRRCAVEAATIFLNKFGLSKDLKLFTIDDVYSFPRRDALRHFFNNARSALPGLISRVKYLNIHRDRDYSWNTTKRKVHIECFTTLRERFYNEDFYCGRGNENPANIKLEFMSTSEISPQIILENALDILPFQHVTHLRLGADLDYPELRAMVEKLPQLEAIIVLAQATAHLVEALLNLQGQLDDTYTTVTSGCLALPMLAHIGIHSDETGIKGKIGWQRCVYGQTWAQLKEFLELRKARNAEMHRLEIKRCRFIDREAVEGLKSCARHVEWDGMCRDVHIEQYGSYESY